LINSRTFAIREANVPDHPAGNGSGPQRRAQARLHDAGNRRPSEQFLDETTRV